MKLEYSICAGIGDNITTRIYLDAIKHHYTEIRISHDKNVIQAYRGTDIAWRCFLDELGNALFNTHPFIFDHSNHREINWNHVRPLMVGHKALPQTPQLNNLCSGSSLKLNEPYIVITTKVRCMSRQAFFPMSIQLWSVLKAISKRYKMVVLGERKIELNREYAGIRNEVFGIYDHIIANVPADRLLDLTVPALGVSVPEMNKIRQDCLIMKEAEAVITLGIGGNFWLAMAVAPKIIGFRIDACQTTDMANNPGYANANITKDFGSFIRELSRYT
jgi:hypothetical protein